MTASWLKQMGWKEVFVLPEAGSETAEPAPHLLGTVSDKALDPSQVIASDAMTVIDLSTSPHYRRGHIPGAWFAIRSRLECALATIAPAGDIVLTSKDGVLASLAAADLAALTPPRCIGLKVVMPPGRRPVSRSPRRNVWRMSRSMSGSSPMSARDRPKQR